MRTSPMDVGYSLRMLSKITEPKEFAFGIKNFLDDFYFEPDIRKVNEEPEFLINVFNDNGLADAYLAAVCESMCNREGYRIPTWADDPKRILKKPFFDATTDNMRIILLLESPTEFRKRNIFVGANALSRV